MQVCGGSGFWDMKRASCLCVETRRRWATMRERRSSNCTARSACSSFGITARGMRPSLCSQGAARRLQKHRRMHSRATVRPCRCGGAGRNDRVEYRRQECQPRPVSSAEHAHGVAAKLLRCSTRAGHALRRSRQCLDRLQQRHRHDPRQMITGLGLNGVTSEQVPAELSLLNGTLDVPPDSCEGYRGCFAVCTDDGCGKAKVTQGGIVEARERPVTIR